MAGSNVGATASAGFQHEWESSRPARRRSRRSGFSRLAGRPAPRRGRLLDHLPPGRSGKMRVQIPQQLMTLPTREAGRAAPQS